MKSILKWTFIAALIFACNSKDLPPTDHLYFELEIFDSIQVNADEQLRAIDFAYDKGVAYGYQTRATIVFDSTGRILVKKSFPEEGPGSIGYIIDIRPLENGDYFVYPFGNQLTLLSEELEIKRQYNVSFPPELRGAAYFRHLVDTKDDKAYLFFPGRDGGNPYFNDFYKKHHVLEKLDLNTGDFEPFLKLPEISKYHDELTYEYPSVSMSIRGDLLYLILDTESYIHVYDLKEGELITSLDFQPQRFLQKQGSKEEFVSSYGEFMRGEIHSVFALSEGVAVHYREGIDQEIFQQEKLLERENWYKQPDYNTQKLKVYQNGSGWSNEIEVPAKVKAISGLSDPDKTFWGLRNDEYVDLEEEFITFYKMRLKHR